MRVASGVWNCEFSFPLQGVPWPESEKNAVDIVMQYAIQRLGFHVEDIVLFSWSIGGFDSTWAAMTYPEIRYLVSVSKRCATGKLLNGTRAKSLADLEGGIQAKIILILNANGPNSSFVFFSQKRKKKNSLDVSGSGCDIRRHSTTGRQQNAK